MTEQILLAQRMHLANLLEAVQRCVFFLEGIDRKISWPLACDFLASNKKDQDLFESLAAMNERFAKLQDTLGAGMRHAHLLLGESADNFLRILVAYEKWGVIDSVETWQLCRTTRNLAARVTLRLNFLSFLMLIERRLNLCVITLEHIGKATVIVVHTQEA